MMLKKRTAVPPSVSARPGAEDAWKALSLMVDLIKHAETKAGLTLAAAGAIGSVVYTLIRSMPEMSATLGTAAGTSAVLVLSAAAFAGLALIPRLRSGPEPINLLYYLHVGAAYGGRSDTYADELTTLMRDPDALVAAIAQQVWSNALVAKQKYRWAGLALNALLGALTALAIMAAISVLQNP